MQGMVLHSMFVLSHTFVLEVGVFIENEYKAG